MLNKHILFLCSWYPSRYGETMGNFVQNHADCASSVAKVSTLFVCAAKEDFGVDYFQEKQTWGKDVLSVNVFYRDSRNPIVKLYRYLQAHLRGLAEIEKQKGKVDLVHLNVIKPAGLIALYLKWFKGLEFIITEHSTVYLPENAAIFSFSHRVLAWFCLKNTKLLATVSKHLGINITKIATPFQSGILNNVVNENLFYPPRTMESAGKFRFIHISTLVPEHKNPEGMIRAFAELHKQRQDFEVLIISDGNTDSSRKQIKDAGLDGVINIEGTKLMAEIADELRQSNCLVSFSNYENMPVVISEAWMCGIPVISTDVGGIAEHINPENGILITKGSESELLDALAAMMENREFYESKHNHIAEYSLKQFSAKRVGERLLEIYGE